MKWAHEDLISGERLQAIAEVTVLTASILAFHRSLRQSGICNIALFPGTHTELKPDPPSIALLRNRRSIFVYSHLLPSFIDRVLPHLDHRFVLISHNSDDRVDDRFLSALDDRRLVHWYAQNTMVNHPKLTPLPIGIANAQWPHGRIDDVIAVAKSAPVLRRNIVYCNFDISTNPAVRVPLKERLAASTITWQAPFRSFRDYLDDMAQCHWCVSPPGNGVDCHRTWEALYLGVVPIVQRTPWGADLHDGLPIIQAEDLSALNPHLLGNGQKTLESQKHDLARLTMRYWRKRIFDKVAETVDRSRS